jgi:hypothetical protein
VWPADPRTKYKEVMSLNFYFDIGEIPHKNLDFQMHQLCHLAVPTGDNYLELGTSCL